LVWPKPPVFCHAERSEASGLRGGRPPYYKAVTFCSLDELSEEIDCKSPR
jgi:hypothetical protein